MKRALVIALLAVMLACTSVAGLSGGSTPDASTNDGGANEGDADAGTGTDAFVDAEMLPPGVIRCPSTAATCTVATAPCCVTVSGMDSPAPRSFTKSSATCDPSCSASYIGSFDTFTMTFTASCSRPSDCSNGDVCCVEGGNGVTAFVCVAAQTCDAP
ncbi:MAG TPA: hypothetical protein VIF62_36050, partial [Labilithrix sp.]